VTRTVATPNPRRRRIGLLALLAGVIALGVALMPMTAGAVHSGPFELEGDALDDSTSALMDDWGTLFPTDKSSTDLGHSFATDLTGANDNGYGSGLTKDTQDIPNWTTDTGAVSPDKDDILHAYAATYVDGTDQLLYFGQDRAPKPNGSTSMGFWFFQNPVSPKGSGGFEGVHKDGDILITSDMTNGGSVSVVNIFEWRNEALVQLESLSGAECGSAPAGMDDVACAIANEEGPIDVPWDYPPDNNPNDPNDVPQNIFFEGGINLSSLFDGEPIPCFSSFLANTRTSPSETADLKDFVVGTIDTCGTITIHKDATPNSAQTFSYNTTGEDEDLPATFDLADPTAGEDQSDTKVFTDLEPGSYSVSEVGLAEWANTELTCFASAGSSADEGGNDTGRVATITLGLAGNVDCTYVNKRKPQLVVVKHVVNDHGGTLAAADFEIDVTGGDASPASFAGAEAPGTEVTLDAGSYSVAETEHPSYAASYSADCSGSIANGETKTCTITNNDKPAKLVVVKHVINDNGGTAVASDFTLDSGGSNDTPDDFQGAEAPGTTVTLDQGAYSVSESGPAGYAASYSADCAGTIAVGQTKTCTVTNNDVAPKLHLRKVLVNNNGGEATLQDFTLTANGAGENDLSGTSPVDSDGTLQADTWTLSETAVAGYAASDWVCEGGTQAANTIAVGIGGEATCTITNNDKRAKLVVIKHVVNDEGGTAVAEDFELSVTGTDASPALFPGAEAPGTDVTLDAGAYDVSENELAGYAASYSADCSGSIANGETKTCTITNDDDILPTVDVTKDADVESINEPGGDVIFTVNVWNTSKEPVTLTSLVDNVYGNLDKDDVGNHSWVSSLCDTGATLTATDGTKGGADTYACTFVGAVRGEGPATHQNEVTAVVTDDEDDTATDKDTATVAIKDVPPPPPPPPAPQIDLSVAKVDAPDPVRLNGQIGYTMLVRNAGPSTATDVRLADPLPAGTSFVSVSTTQGTCSFTGGLVQCSLGTIPAGGSVSVSMVVKANRAGMLLNEVTVVGKEPESNTANNRATATTLVLTPLLPPKPKPVCSTLTVGQKILRVGKRSTITAMVKNRGKAVKRAKVVVRGPGIAKSARTNAKGKVRITVRPARPGIVIVSVRQKLVCGSKRIGVVGVFEPPVTG
jgi:uncharacterized repeat protein (TIGR01451 family)